MSKERRKEKVDPLAELSYTQRIELDFARRMARAVGLYLPLAVTAVATLVTAAWISRMPDPMATHWGADMRPDGFGPPWSNAAMALVTGLGVTALYGLQGLQGLQAKSRGSVVWSSMHRFLPAVVFGTTVFIQVIAVGIAWIQLDSEDAREVRLSGWVLLLAFVVWIAATVAAFFLQPKLVIERPDRRVAQPLALEANERAVWVKQISASKPVIWLLAVVLALSGAATVWAIGTDPIAAWIVGLTFLLMFAAMVTTLWYRVRIDASGLKATAVLGWPVFRIPADEIESVQVVHITPYAEFGGWGLRWAPGRFGIVLRTGEGIVVTRRKKRDFALPIDDAQVGAALLAAAADGDIVAGREEQSDSHLTDSHAERNPKRREKDA